MTVLESTHGWVKALSSDTLFRAVDAPGHTSRRSEALHTLSRGSEPLLERISAGIYWKRLEQNVDCTIGFSTQCLTQALGWMAGTGGGLAGLTALRAFGWATQLPTTYRVKSLREEPVSSSISHISWMHSSAEHRRSLTWEEVSLIEAVTQWLGSEDYAWNEVLKSLGANTRLGRMPKHVTLRPAAIEAVVNHEEPSDLERLCRSLGDTSIAPLEVRLTEACAALREQPNVD